MDLETAQPEAVGEGPIVFYYLKGSPKLRFSFQRLFRILFYNKLGVFE